MCVVFRFLEGRKGGGGGMVCLDSVMPTIHSLLHAYGKEERKKSQLTLEHGTALHWLRATLRIIREERLICFFFFWEKGKVVEIVSRLSD